MNDEKIFLVLLLISFGIISCKSSYNKIGSKNANYIPYYLKVYEADSLFIIGNYQKSFEILDNLFKRYESVNMNNYVEYGTYLNVAVLSNNNSDLKSKVKNAYLKYGGITTISKNSNELRMKLNELSLLSNAAIKLIEVFILMTWPWLKIESTSKLKIIFI